MITPAFWSPKDAKSNQYKAFYNRFDSKGERTMLRSSIWLKVCWHEGTPSIVSFRMETFNRASLFLLLLLSTTAVNTADEYKIHRSGHAAISHGRFILVVVLSWEASSSFVMMGCGSTWDHRCQASGINLHAVNTTNTLLVCETGKRLVRVGIKKSKEDFWRTEARPLIHY